MIADDGRQAIFKENHFRIMSEEFEKELKEFIVSDRISERAKLIKEIEDKLPKEISDPFQDIVSREHQNGFNQCRTEFQSLLNSLKV